MQNLQLVMSNNVEEIEVLVAKGFCPVECSIGGKSIVDSLMMDHHGELSHLESVAIRAYRDHYGARKADPRFVGTGVADADMTFAIASLAGLIPHPNREVGNVPPPVKASMTKDLTDLATTIARVDSSPIGLNIPALPGGDVLLTWSAMSNNGRDTLGLYQSVGLWRSLTEGNPAQTGPFLKAAKESEVARREASITDFESRALIEDGAALIEGSRVFGFPEWYCRNEAAPFESAAGWEYPVVVAHLENGGNITMGCPNDTVAAELFGEGGLKNVFPHLKPDGWGGRESVGGSPRGVVLSAEEALEVFRTVVTLMKKPATAGS